MNNIDVNLNNKKCTLKKKNFGGVLGWYFKRLFPHLASTLYIRANFIMRRRRTWAYIRWFMNQDEPPQPIAIEIETVNRCNSTCEFCPANKNNDKRPFAKLSDEEFYKIISDLKDWGYKGMISLYVNNEPLIDNRIIEFHRYVKKELPDCRVKFFTNGTLLTIEKFKKLIPYIDYMVINNYGETMRLHPNVESIVSEVNENKSQYMGKEIVVNIRYIKDVLTNRAGEAPNKKAECKIIKEPCLMPYTDLVVFSSGEVGICCNDATEKTRLCNINNESLESIWKNQYEEIRKKMVHGRQGYSFCKYCDTMDSGFRLKQINKMKVGGLHNENK